MVEAGQAQQQPEAAANQAPEFDFEGHTFSTPDKTIITVEHVEEFKNSNGHNELLGFITALMNACKTTQMSTTPLTEVSITCLISTCTL